MSLDRRTFVAQLAAALGAGALGPRAFADDKRPHILLKTGWQTVNIGDIGHTPGMLRLLEERLPNVDVTLWPNNIGDGVEEMLLRNFPKVKVARGEAVKEAFKNCQFLLHGSGPSLVGAKDVKKWVDETGKPFGVCGITYGGFNPGGDRPILDKAAFVFYRDTLSLERAKQDAITAPIQEFGPDAAFSVHLRNDAAATEFLKKNALEDGKFLCVIPRLRNSPYWVIHGRKMTETDEKKHAENEAMKERDHALVRPAIVEFIRTTGMKVLLCPEDKSHMAVGKENFYDKLPEDVKPKVVWRENYWLTDEALSTYVRSFGLLSMDMHSPIMAIGNGIPAIVCRFKQQTSKGQMWKDIGLGEWLFDLDVETEPARITAATLDMAKDPAVTKAKVAKALEVVRERQRVQMETLKKTLG